jgi:hypothetical protein
METVRYTFDTAAENATFPLASRGRHEVTKTGATMKTIFAVLVLTLLPGLATAQINKCLDASGKAVAYATECPPGTRSEQTNIKNNPGQSAPAQKSLAEREADFKKRQIEKQEADAKAAKSGAEVAQRKQACADSQAYLKNLQEGQRIRTRDAKTGEQRYLADAEYAKEVAKTQETLSKNCK